MIRNSNLIGDYSFLKAQNNIFLVMIVAYYI